jgi:hypothetical protein
VIGELSGKVMKDPRAWVAIMVDYVPRSGTAKLVK